MIRFDAIALASLLAVVSTIAAQQEPAADPETESIAQTPAVDVPPTSAERLALVEEDIAMLEAMLRVRESRITEIRRFLDLERDILDTVREQRQVGASPPRQVELIEVRVASAEAQLGAREAERDEIVIRLEQLRRVAASPSPETDRDERRARLQDEVRIRAAQLKARKARVKAAEVQITSEKNSQANFIDSVRRGVASPGAARQAMFRVAEATTWRDTMAAERDFARIQLRRAERRLDQFDDPDATDPDLDRPTVEDLGARLTAVEHLVDVLRDELYHVQWELQGFRNQQHERFGMRDRFGTPPTVLP